MPCLVTVPAASTVEVVKHWSDVCLFLIANASAVIMVHAASDAPTAASVLKATCIHLVPAAQGPIYLFAVMYVCHLLLFFMPLPCHRCDRRQYIFGVVHLSVRECFQVEASRPVSPFNTHCVNI